jgi:transcriptional regulator
METNEKVKLLKEKGLDWLEIAEILSITYEEVRAISEGETETEDI